MKTMRFNFRSQHRRRSTIDDSYFGAKIPRGTIFWTWYNYRLLLVWSMLYIHYVSQEWPYMSQESRMNSWEKSIWALKSSKEGRIHARAGRRVHCSVVGGVQFFVHGMLPCHVSLFWLWMSDWLYVQRVCKPPCFRILGWRRAFKLKKVTLKLSQLLRSSLLPRVCMSLYSKSIKNIDHARFLTFILFSWSTPSVVTLNSVLDCSGRTGSASYDWVRAHKSRDCR